MKLAFSMLAFDLAMHLLSDDLGYRSADAGYGGAESLFKAFFIFTFFAAIICRFLLS